MLLSRSTTQPLLDVNAGSISYSPLMIACKSGHIGVVKELLERGGDKVEVNRVIKGSALTGACDSGNMEILELLLNHPTIDVNQKILSGSTLLHHICHHNQLAQLKRLLQLPTLKLNPQSELGLTPLIVACQNGRSLVVSELLKYKKVNPNICDSQNRTALWLAIKRDCLPPLCPYYALPIGCLTLPRSQKTKNTPNNMRIILGSMPETVTSSWRNMVALSRMSTHIQASDFIFVFFSLL